MFDWENLRCFLAVGQAGSLSAAARHLKVDHATVSRRLAALEGDLKVRLVDRLPRSCELTESGRQIFELATRMEGDAFAIERAARAGQCPVAGKVTMSVPPVLGVNFFAQQLLPFRRQHPNIQCALASQVQSVSLGRREADIAIRLYRPVEPGNVARKIGEMPFGLYASLDYEFADTPSQWGFIAYEAQFADMTHEKWLRQVADGREVVAELSDLTTQHMAARTGIGVAGLPRFMGDNDAALQRLPNDREGFMREIWLVVHDDLRHSPLLRVVIDFMAAAASATFPFGVTAPRR